MHRREGGGFAKPILRHLRKLVHEACPDTEETLKWSAGLSCMAEIMAGWRRSEHCTFGFWHQGMGAELGPDGEKEATAMGASADQELEDLPPTRRCPLHPEGRRVERVRARGRGGAARGAARAGGSRRS
jgi:hypothetical protein